MTRRACVWALAALLLSIAASRPEAAILYESYAGFRLAGAGGEAYILRQGIEPNSALLVEFSRGGALCPALDTPDYLCASANAAAELLGTPARVLALRAESSVRRRNAVGLMIEHTYAGGSLTITELGGSGTMPPVGIAYFNFGLRGTASESTSSAGVTTQAIARATLSTSTNMSLQCAGRCSIPVPFVQNPPGPTSDWVPRFGFVVTLRVDTVVGAALGTDGWQADVIADFYDTLEVLAIEVHDENDQPVPGAFFTITNFDGKGGTLEIPNEPPPTTTSTLPGGTTTTTTGGGTTTSTTLPGGTTARLVSGKSFLLTDKTNPAKQRASFVSKDSVLAIDGLDPTQGGAALRLAGLVTAQRDAWPMPASGWKATKKGFKYKDKTEVNGPVTAAVLADGKLVVQAKGGAIAYALLGTGPQQAMAVAVVFPEDSPTIAVCAEFPGSQGSLKKDDPAKGVFSAKKAEAPSSCRGF